VNKQCFALVGLALLVFALPIAGQPKYGVTAVADKGTDFATVKTYTWQSGWDANDKKVHAQIVSGVDRELKALGLTLKTTGPSDAVVKYAALRRVDVEVSMLANPDAARRQYDVGSLLIVMTKPGTSTELWRARIDKPIEVEPAAVEAAVNSALVDIFAKYPTKKK
jgi:uncharacterized protein (DUF3084 family)